MLGVLGMFGVLGMGWMWEMMIVVMVVADSYRISAH